MVALQIWNAYRAYAIVCIDFAVEEPKVIKNIYVYLYIEL